MPLTAPPESYKRRIHGWDVVNEGLNDDGTLRDSSWRRRIGDDDIAHAFEFAHEADPDAELYYNDCNLAKRPARFASSRAFSSAGSASMQLASRGIGAFDTATASDIDQAIADRRETGVKVMITELDVNLLPNVARGQPPSAAADPYANGLPDDVQRALTRRCADAFRVFLTHRADVARVTFWGVSDADSWLNRGRTNHPLLWDRQRKPKPAFDAAAAVLAER